MKNAFTTLTLGLCASAFAFSQTPAASTEKLVLSAGLMFAQGNALDLTHKGFGGYGAEVGYQFSPKDFGVDIMIYGGWKKLPAATPTANRATYEMVGPHVGFDLIYKPWDSLPITISTGPSVHVWQVEQQGVSNGIMGDQGVKLGWRAGVAYSVNQAWSVGLKYTISEWKSNPDQNLTSRPAYASLMASYRF